MPALITESNRRQADLFTADTGVNLMRPSGVADADLELEIHNRRHRVDWSTFRSWTGRRWIDEVEYFGPVYYLGTTKVSR